MLKPADRLPLPSAKKKPCGCAGKSAARAGAAVTRPSCLECVEKHLGAAWVLIAEHRDGYPHRLRAVGHLHEAEDESQVWPELHDAIRAARKAYQQAGTVPEFAVLAQRMAALRLPDPSAQPSAEAMTADQTNVQET